MKKGPIYYPEHELVEKHQRGEYNWVDYIAHHSDEWCEEYEAFCKDNDFDEDDDTAAQLFVEHKDEELEEALLSENA